MIIGAPKEIAVDEKRVAMTPDSATQLQKLGYDCLVQSGAGLHAGFSDAAYEKAGVKIAKTAAELWKTASRAQKMDALSSMANIAGYRSVIEAGNNFGRFFTGQITAAGKVPPAKVLVVGAGVAGLAAIGTATSLGAITLAFDVRPEVAEQIESMGAEFVYLDFEEAQQDGAATGGN